MKCDKCGNEFTATWPCPWCSHHEREQFREHYSDPTPLADLTDEQWRGMGFSLGENVNANPAWYLPRATLCYHVTNEELWYSIVAMREVTTLGRLRHLLAALGSAG